MNPVWIVCSEETELQCYACNWSGMDKNHYMAFRLKWANDIFVIDELTKAIEKKAENIAKEQNWKIPKGREYIKKMSKLAVLEFHRPHQYNTADIRAKFVGMDKANWSRVWGDRYEECYKYLNWWSVIAFRAIWKNQEEECES